MYYFTIYAKLCQVIRGKMPVVSAIIFLPVFRASFRADGSALPVIECVKITKFCAGRINFIDIRARLRYNKTVIRSVICRRGLTRGIVLWIQI